MALRDAAGGGGSGRADGDPRDLRELSRWMLRYRMSRNIGMDATDSALRNLREAEGFTDDLVRVESGWMVRAVRFGGPGLLIVSIGFDIATGKPPPQTIVAHGIGLAVTLGLEGTLGLWAIPIGLAIEFGAEKLLELVKERYEDSMVYVDERWCRLE